MKKNKVTSYFNVYIKILNIFLIPILLIMLMISILNGATNEFKIPLTLTVVILVSLQILAIPFLESVLNRLCVQTVTFSKNLIVYQKNEYSTIDDIRVVYSKINLDNLIFACAGELVVICDGKQIKLGSYTRSEVKKIQSLISNLEYSSDIIKK